MRLVFAGTPQTAVPSLDALLASRHEVVAVVTRPDAPAGRGRKVESSPVARRAAEAGIEVLTPARARDPQFLDRLREIAPDCCPMVAYGALLPQSALDIPPHGWVNLHFSVLPAWRGAAPVQHAILHGDDVTGASTFQSWPGARRRPGLRRADRAGAARRHDRRRCSSGCRTRGRELLVATLDGIEDGHDPGRPAARRGRELRPEDHPGRCAGGLEAARARDRPADPRVHARSGCLDRTRRRPAQARPGVRWTLPPGAPLDPSRPVSCWPDATAVFVGTGSRPVRLGDVQAAGKRRMTAADWARGLQPGGPVRFG